MLQVIISGLSKIDTDVEEKIQRVAKDKIQFKFIPALESHEKKHAKNERVYIIVNNAQPKVREANSLANEIVEIFCKVDSIEEIKCDVNDSRGSLFGFQGWRRP